VLHAVVDKHVSKPERIALVAKSTPGFDVEQARADETPREALPPCGRWIASA